MNGVDYISNRDKELIVSNADLQDVAIDKDCKKYQVVIPEHSMHMVLAGLIRKPGNEPLIFNPKMNLKFDHSIAMWW